MGRTWNLLVVNLNWCDIGRRFPGSYHCCHGDAESDYTGALSAGCPPRDPAECVLNLKRHCTAMLHNTTLIGA